MKLSYCLTLLAVCVQVAFGASSIAIHDRLISKGFGEGRQGQKIDTVVLHFSSNVGADRQNPHDVEAVIKLYEKSNSSAHYLIDRDGKVYRLVNEEDTAYHAGEGTWKGRTNTLNRYSIGIEMLAIGTFEEMTNIVNITKTQFEAISSKHLGYTEAQYTSLKALLSDIRTRHPAVKSDRDHIIGHSRYAPARKHDPGVLFKWSKIGL